MRDCTRKFGQLFRPVGVTFELGAVDALGRLLPVEAFQSRQDLPDDKLKARAQLHDLFPLIHQPDKWIFRASRGRVVFTVWMPSDPR